MQASEPCRRSSLRRFRVCPSFDSWRSLRLAAWPLAACASALAGCGAFADSDTGRFDPVRVLQPGCGSGELRLLVERRGLRGGHYVVRTEVTVQGQRYMDERASIHEDGSSDWRLYDDHSFAPPTTRADWPLPPAAPLRIDFTLMRPAGRILDRQSLVLQDCASGRIRFRSAVLADGFE